jgi:hypothetical protein
MKRKKLTWKKKGTERIWHVGRKEKMKRKK